MKYWIVLLLLWNLALTYDAVKVRDQIYNVAAWVDSYHR